jgi:hypothetical protein
MKEPSHPEPLKIVYYGPGLAGKFTNIEKIHAASNAPGTPLPIGGPAIVSLSSLNVPRSIPDEAGCLWSDARFQLWSPPGSAYHDPARRFVLRGADAIIFVADSQLERADANIEWLWELKQNLATLGVQLSSLPYVLQLNKRDLPNAMPVEALLADLKLGDEPVFEAVAIKGKDTRRVRELRRRCASASPTESDRVVTADSPHPPMRRSVK